jgi:uncharacterized protein YjbJ (UPF0337 family)
MPAANDEATPEEERSTKGVVKEVIGWATGDRRVEAEGRAETKKDEDPETVEQAEHEVRADHGDIKNPD